MHNKKDDIGKGEGLAIGIKDARVQNRNETYHPDDENLQGKSEMPERKRHGSARLFALCINDMRDNCQLTQTPKKGHSPVEQTTKACQESIEACNPNDKREDIEREMHLKCAISEPCPVKENSCQSKQHDSQNKPLIDAAEALILSWSPENNEFKNGSINKQDRDVKLIPSGDVQNNSSNTNTIYSQRMKTGIEEGYVKNKLTQNKSSSKIAREEAQKNAKQSKQESKNEWVTNIETRNSHIDKFDGTKMRHIGKLSELDLAHGQKTNGKDRQQADEKYSDPFFDDCQEKVTKKLYEVRKEVSGGSERIRLTDPEDSNVLKGCGDLEFGGIHDQGKASLLHVETGRGNWRDQYDQLGASVWQLAERPQTNQFYIPPSAQLTPRGMKRRRSGYGDHNCDDEMASADVKGELTGDNTPKKHNGVPFTVDMADYQHKTSIDGDFCRVQRKKSLLSQDFCMAHNTSICDSAASSSFHGFQETCYQTPQKTLKISPGAGMIHFPNFSAVPYSPNVQGYRPPTPHSPELFYQRPMTCVDAEGHRYRGDIFSYYRNVPPPDFNINAFESQNLQRGPLKLEECPEKPISSKENPHQIIEKEINAVQSSLDYNRSFKSCTRRRSGGLLQIASNYVEDEHEQDCAKSDQENIVLEKCSSMKLNTPSPSQINSRCSTLGEKEAYSTKQTQEQIKMQNEPNLPRFMQNQNIDPETPKHPHCQDKNKKGEKNQNGVTPKQLFAKTKSPDTKQTSKFAQSTGAILTHLRKGEDKKSNRQAYPMINRGVGRGVLNSRGQIQLTRNKSMSAIKTSHSFAQRDSVTRRRSEPDVTESNNNLRQTPSSATEPKQANSGDNVEIDWFENNASEWKRCQVGHFQKSGKNKEAQEVGSQVNSQTTDSSTYRNTTGPFWMQEYGTPNNNLHSLEGLYTPLQSYSPHGASLCQSVDVVPRQREKVVPEWRRRSLPSRMQNQNGEAYGDNKSGFTPSSHLIDRNAWKERLKQKYDNVKGTYIDSHCHIDFTFNRTPFKGSFAKFKDINADTWPTSFRGCIAVFCDPRTFSPRGGLWKDVLSDPNVWGAIGCHPKSAVDFHEYTEENLKKMILHPKVKALGEIGLDYSGTFYQHSEVQKNVFERQIKIALAANKPIVIHSRDSESDCVEILEKLVPRNYKIHRHCFTGDWSEAENWLRKFPNSYIGLTPLITLPWATRAKAPREVASKIPLNKLLLETDAPYFIPGCVPKNAMKLSHPGMAVTVADEVARLQGISLEEVLEATLQNTQNMYNLNN